MKRANGETTSRETGSPQVVYTPPTVVDLGSVKDLTLAKKAGIMDNNNMS